MPAVRVGPDRRAGEHADRGADRVPALIVRGGRDDVDRPRWTSYEVHCLIETSKLVDPPWPENVWERALEAQSEGRGNLFDTWIQAAPLILDFAKGA